ncbi:MAG: hypothetical protein J0M02_05510 [Planctomycetes bacterium]|nr:hypothetical protein [Planctomycetota bacterium]
MRLPVCAIILVAWLATSCQAAESGTGWRGKALHLTIAVINGSRWSETRDDPSFAHFHDMARALALRGAVYAGFRNSGIELPGSPGEVMHELVGGA